MPHRYETNPIQAKRFEQIRVAAKEAAGLEPTSDFLTPEEEQELAVQVQSGNAALALLESSASQPSRVWAGPAPEDAIKQGEKARDALVLSNLPFIAWCVRISMGIQHPTDDGKAVGTYAPLFTLKHPRADYDDRFQAAVVGAIKSTRRFEPGYQVDAEGKSPKYITYLAWAIQSAIQKHMYEEEWRGVRPSQDKQEDIRRLFNVERSNPINFTPEQQRVMAATDALDLDKLTGLHTAPEETDDFEYPVELKPEEVLADRFTQSDLEVQQNVLNEQITDILESMSEREAGIITQYYGLNGATPQSFQQIADTYGVTDYRIKQIFKKALQKLKHKSRSGELEGWLGNGDEAFFEEDVDKPLIAGDEFRMKPLSERLSPHLRLVAPVVEQNGDSLPVGAASEERASWQSYADEPWEMDERFGGPAAVAKSFEKTLEDVKSIFSDTKSYHFDERFRKIVNTPFPVGILEDIKKVSEGHLNAQMVEQVSQYFLDTVVPRYEAILGEQMSYVRCGELISKLLVDSMTPEDKVTLSIPESLSGKIDNLGMNLAAGLLIVKGDVGERFAAGAKGMAVVRLFGNAGDYAGIMAKQDAVVTIMGDAGIKAGAFSKDNATVVVQGNAAAGYNYQAS